MGGAMEVGEVAMCRVVEGSLVVAVAGGLVVTELARDGARLSAAVVQDVEFGPGMVVEFVLFLALVLPGAHSKIDGDACSICDVRKTKRCWSRGGELRELARGFGI